MCFPPAPAHLPSTPREGTGARATGHRRCSAPRYASAWSGSRAASGVTTRAAADNADRTAAALAADTLRVAEAAQAAADAHADRTRAARIFECSAGLGTLLTCSCARTLFAPRSASPAHSSGTVCSTSCSFVPYGVASRSQLAVSILWKKATSGASLIHSWQILTRTIAVDRVPRLLPMSRLL